VKKTSNKAEIQPKKDPAVPAGNGQDFQQAIAAKAYELYERAGRIDGHDVEHWLEAEQLVLAENNGGGASSPRKAVGAENPSGIPRIKSAGESM